ncbi:MAG: hypothetical protein LLF94_00100 [Chlamydiales bacterium]|nr:hypothetical protein [Chlamydiales bacterium]
MRLKHFIFGLMAMLTLATSIQQPLFADKKHSSSSTSHKDDKCCKKSKKLLKQINQTTMQDLVVDQTTLNVVNQINQTTKADLAVDEETLEIVKHLVDCSCTCTVILPQDFMDDEGNLTQTYYITEPGSYCLGADVAFFPLDEFTPAINILANDVRLDLRGFTLSQDPESGTPNAYGVQIGEGYFYNDPDAVLKNITITNGSIINFTAIGVFCYNGSFDEPTAEVAFESLTFTDLNILNCGSNESTDFGSGIDLDSVADQLLFEPNPQIAYRNVRIENCHVNYCLGASAVNIFTGENVIIKDSQANNLSTTISLAGIVSAYLVPCINIQMYNCQGNNTSNFDVEAGQTNGIYLFLSNKVYVQNCQFNDIYGESGVVWNDLSSCQNAVFENVQFNGLSGGETVTALNGVHMSDIPFQETQGNGVKFINCQFNDITRPTSGTLSRKRNLSGCRVLTVRNIVFENCQAVNIGTDNPFYDCFGIQVSTQPEDPIPEFSSSRNISIVNCVVSDISGVNKAVGIFNSVVDLDRIGEQATLSNMVVENCIAERIYSTSTTELVAGIAEGINLANIAVRVLPAMFNLYVNDCRVSDVRAGEQNPLSAGIVAQSVNRPDISNNSVSDCDRGILLTGTDSIFPNNLFQLAATPEDATAFPPVFIDLTSIPSSTPAQTFTNTVAGRGGPVSINPSTSSVDLNRDYILSTPTDLNFSGGVTRWQPGDTILYNNGGGTNIGGLTSGTTYYLIVYIPGFSKNGLIQNNEVDNCSISCYQDDQDTTSSAWVNNTAFNCGVMPTQFTNYDIDFAGVRPVDAGTLTAYPVGGNKYYNLSLVP